MTTVTEAHRAESPTSPSLKRLSPKQVTRLFQGEDSASTALLQMDMGAFMDSDGVVHIGLVEADVHEHDRWFFAHHPQSAKAQLRGWWMKDDKAAACQPQQYERLEQGSKTVLQLLNFNRQLVRQLRLRLLQNDMGLVDATETMAASSLLRSADLNDLVDVDYSAPMYDMHLLVHHFEEFVEKHPDHAGMRRQNLLSLYGLFDPYR